jgi:hypothetical protein
MKLKTHYLNTDLDLQAQLDLAPLADSLSHRGFYVFHILQHEDGSWSARFETEERFEDPESNIAAMLTAIESLEEPARSLWTACTIREFDIGYDCGQEPEAFRQHLTATTLTRIAQVGGSVVITLYPAIPDPGPTYLTATAKFSPITQRTSQGKTLDWQSYIAWSKLTHLKEVVTLDCILGESVVERDNQLDADFLVWEDSIPLLYTRLDYLLTKLEGKDPLSYNLLAVTKEPTAPCETSHVGGFEFIGYDLLDVEGGNSALTNCGGFDNTFLPHDLNEYGLLSTYQKAYTIKEELLKNNPDEPHANCQVWAIWRIR